MRGRADTAVIHADALVRKGHREILWERDPHACIWCGRSLSWRAATLEHFMPRSRGGPYVSENLFLACRRCNGERGDLGATRFAHHCVMDDRRVALGMIIDRLGASIATLEQTGEYSALVAYLCDKRRGLSFLMRLVKGRRSDLGRARLALFQTPGSGQRTDADILSYSTTPQNRLGGDPEGHFPEDRG